jgi:ribosomal protein L7/L12
METFAGLDPWLVVGLVAVASFLAGRRSVQNSGEWLRFRETERQAELTRFAALDPGEQAEIRNLMAAGRKIDAIKHYRELTGSGLKASKELVEALVAG